jgi:hypothetical protein
MLDRLPVVALAVVAILTTIPPSVMTAGASAQALEEVCVGLGGDALSQVTWTAAQIAEAEAQSGRPVARVHPETGTCQDPAGLPVGTDATAFAWVCWEAADGGWYGPSWGATIYLTDNSVPPNRISGRCPRPQSSSVPAPSATELAAATAVYLSQLEARGDFGTLYEWMHPAAQAVVPRAAIVGWYAAEWFPRGPAPIRVSRVRFVEWTWPVTGQRFPNTAEIDFEQRFADGSLVNETVRLVQDEFGAWRWFFGRDRAFVEAQIARYAPSSP